MQTLFIIDKANDIYTYDGIFRDNLSGINKVYVAKKVMKAMVFLQL